MSSARHSKLSRIIQPATQINARRAGLRLGKDVHISPGGKYTISNRAKVVVGNETLLGKDHRIEASGGSEIYIGSNVRFHERLRIQAVDGALIHIADNCYFHHDVSILSHTSITIGDGCLFAAFSYLSDHNHEIKRSAPIQAQGFTTEPLVVGDDVWLGVGATLVKGEMLGDGVVIAARSLVNKTVPAYEIWGGVPAKKLGERE